MCKGEGQLFAAVLFLDIDGVLHPVDAEEDEFFGGPQMEQLHRIVEASGAQVVLSSTWRLSPVHMRQATERLEAVSMLLKPQGKTPNLQHHGRAVPWMVSDFASPVLEKCLHLLRLTSL